MPRFALLATLILIVASVVAAQSPFLDADDDTLLAIKCRKRIAADPQLSALGLSVDVINRVAIVGGSAPTPDAGSRVETLLSAVPGLGGVKVSCWVPATPDPLIARVGEKLRGTTAQPASPPEVKPPERDAHGLPPLLLLPHPQMPEPTSRITRPELAMRVPPPPVATVTRYAGSGTLGEPIADPVPRLAELLSRVRAADSRFAGLNADLDGGMVRVSGRVRDYADSWDYVAEVRRLPGVKRVILGTIVAD